MFHNVWSDETFQNDKMNGRNRSGCAEQQWFMLFSQQNASKLENTKSWMGNFIDCGTPYCYCAEIWHVVWDQKWALSSKRLVKAYHVTVLLPKKIEAVKLCIWLVDSVMVWWDEMSDLPAVQFSLHTFMSEYSATTRYKTKHAGLPVHWFIALSLFWITIHFSGKYWINWEKPDCVTNIGLWDYPSPARFNLPCTEKLRLNLAQSCQGS